MLLTTTAGVPGKTLQLLGIVGAQEYCQLDATDDPAADPIRMLEKGRESVLEMLAEKARDLGGDTAVGISLSICSMHNGNCNGILIMATGTAAKFLGPWR
ncbi:MAG: heavy metal-binding domain-containing protein [Bacillota bacterium]